MNRPRFPVALVSAVLVSSLLAHPAGSVASGPRPQAADTVRYAILMQGNPAGYETIWREEGGEYRFHFEFNDRGRGPKLDVTATLDASGLPTKLSARGVNYLKVPVEERFSLEGARASWDNGAERGEVTLETPALYLAMNGTPALSALGARALLRAPGGRLPLLPGGEASIRPTGVTLTAEASASSDRSGEAVEATLYEIDGLDFSPSYVWLDEDDDFFGASFGWMGVVREGWEGALPEMAEAQQTRESAWLETLAESLTDRPRAPIAIVGARLFDPTTLSTRPGTTVLVEGNRIRAVGPDGEVEIPEGALVIDAEERALLPGLHDMHTHLSPVDGILHIAAGVTTVRDLANDIDRLLDLRARFDDGRAIGPRVIMAGFMDGPGPFAGPTKVLVDTKEEVREWVRKYAELGYEQIKMYSSIDTELVPTIIEAAHERGLRVSGHIPAFMTAEQAVRLGFDEIQHANMLFLNFLGDTLDTRTPARFTEVARLGVQLDIASDSVQDFLALLREREVVVDPTVSIWEGMFTARSGEISPQFAAIADRLPPTVSRRYLTGGLPVPEGMDGTYRESFGRILDLVAELHRQGIRLVPGTDAMAGFALHRELELYEQAGIPAPEVLRIATLGSAEVTGREGEVGSIEPGKLADLILVDGDPSARISDIRNVTLVMKDGVVYDPDALYRAIGVAPGRRRGR